MKNHREMTLELKNTHIRGKHIKGERRPFNKGRDNYGGSNRWNENFMGKYYNYFKFMHTKI